MPDSSLRADEVSGTDRHAMRWRLFFVLWVAAVAVTPLVVPYFQGLIAVAPYPRSLPPHWFALAMASNAVEYAIEIPLALLASRKVGLELPYLERWLYGTAVTEPLRTVVWPAVFWAVATALVAFAIDAVFVHAAGMTQPAPEIHARIPGVAAWRGIPAGVSAGLTEELTFRLFLMSGVAWLIGVVTHASEGKPSVVLWTANIVAAVVFGWAHLGGVEMFGPASPLVEARTFLIILGPGIAFGWLLMRYGFEAAVISHFMIDIIVHTIRPLLQG